MKATTMEWFEHDGRLVPVDETHPVDILEPEDESTTRSTRDPITVIDWIGGSYLRGDPFIIQVAWSFLLNRQSRSMAACAKELGCTRQAISRQVTRLANEFGCPLRNKIRRYMQREAAIGVVTSDPYGPAKGIRTALEITDTLLTRLPEVHSERKRHVAACEAFRKVFAKA